MILLSYSPGHIQAHCLSTLDEKRGSTLDGNQHPLQRRLKQRLHFGGDPSGKPVPNGLGPLSVLA